MNSFLTSVTLAPLLVLSCSAFGQELVSHSPQDRTVLLEEFSAIHCGNCPAAHVLADQLVAAHPGQVIAAEVHGGGLSVPGAGEPDLRNPSSTALWSFYAVASQPRGPVDRRPYNGQVVLSTSAWAAAVNEALLLPSPVNIGLASQFDAGTRDLTVNVELYYTADGTGGNDRISVFLKEDHIIGYQQDYVNGAQAAYDHNDVLRGYITDLWGDEVTSSTAGTTVTRTYAFTVPVEWNIANCAVVACVGEYQDELYQAREVAADGGMTTSLMEASVVEFGKAFPVPAGQLVFIPFNAELGPVALQVIDHEGRLVRSVQNATKPDVITVDVLDLASGVYTYRLVSPMAMCTGRFIVQH